MQGFGVGPDFVETLRPDAYLGRDFERVDMIDADVVVFQNPPDNEVLRRHFGRQIGSMKGFRWDPLSAVVPAVSLTPITREPQAEFELVWRIQPGADTLSSEWFDELSQAFPEAVFAPPERVSDVIDRRFETLGRLATLGGVLVLSAVILSLLLTTLVLAQILSQEYRSLAIRMALGAGPWRALQHWGIRFGAAMILSLAVGIWVNWSLNRTLSAYVFGYQSAPSIAMLAVACLLLLIVTVALLLAARNISRVNLQAALSE